MPREYGVCDRRVKPMRIQPSRTEYSYRCPALAVDSELDWYESLLRKPFEIKQRGRLGVGCSGSQEIRILNRIVRLDEDGLTHEADPRHADLLL